MISAKKMTTSTPKRTSMRTITARSDDGFSQTYVIDADTRPREFRAELRNAEVYYHFAKGIRA